MRRYFWRQCRESARRRESGDCARIEVVSPKDDRTVALYARSMILCFQALLRALQSPLPKRYADIGGPALTCDRDCGRRSALKLAQTQTVYFLSGDILLAMKTVRSRLVDYLLGKRKRRLSERSLRTCFCTFGLRSEQPPPSQEHRHVGTSRAAAIHEYSAYALHSEQPPAR